MIDQLPVLPTLLGREKVLCMQFGCSACDHMHVWNVDWVPYYHEKIACRPFNVWKTTWASILGLRLRGFFFHVCNSAMTNAVVFYQMRFCLVSCRDARDLQRSLGTRIPKSPKRSSEGRSAEIPRILQRFPQVRYSENQRSWNEDPSQEISALTS